jgi:hypothetical protein
MATRRVEGQDPSDNGLERVQWDQYTFQLPKRLPTTTTTSIRDATVRERFFRLTIEGISSAQNAPALTKLRCLESRFKYPNLTNEINGALVEMYNDAAGAEAPIVLTNPMVFKLSAPSVRSETGNDLGLPVGNADFNQNARRQARYYCFKAEI